MHLPITLALNLFCELHKHLAKVTAIHSLGISRQWRILGCENRPDHETNLSSDGGSGDTFFTVLIFLGVEYIPYCTYKYYVFL